MMHVMVTVYDMWNDLKVAEKKLIYRKILTLETREFPKTLWFYYDNDCTLRIITLWGAYVVSMAFTASQHGSSQLGLKFQYGGRH